MTISVFTTGGTIDKVYFDAASEFQVGDPAISEIFIEAGVSFEYQVESICRKDSLEMTDDDRALIKSRVEQCANSQILITHGTDTMAQTASHLKSIKDKTIVFTGAMQPARLRSTDAIFNVGFAVAAVQTLPFGVYIAMNGKIFHADMVRKNRQAQKFEALE